MNHVAPKESRRPRAARRAARATAANAAVAAQPPSARDTGRSRWLEVAYDDISGIDADIERAVAMLQRAHDCPREHARTELVRRLSVAGEPS